VTSLLTFLKNTSFTWRKLVLNLDYLHNHNLRQIQGAMPPKRPMKFLI